MLALHVQEASRAPSLTAIRVSYVPPATPAVGQTRSPAVESVAPGGMGVALQASASPSGSEATKWTRIVSPSIATLGPGHVRTGSRLKFAIVTGTVHAVDSPAATARNSRT